MCKLVLAYLAQSNTLPGQAVMELLCHDGNKKKKEPPKISERIVRNDYTLYHSDFYPPHDNRELVSDFANRNETEYYYQFVYCKIKM